MGLFTIVSQHLWGFEASPDCLPWESFFNMLSLVAQHICMLVISVLGYLKSRDNHRKLLEMERTLNGKVSNTEE